MSIKWLNNYQGTLVVLGLLLGILMAAPACFASGAVTIVPDEEQLAPKGSYIPDRRVKEVLNKIEKRKAMIEEKKALQQQEQRQADPLPKPQSTKEK